MPKVWIPANAANVVDAYQAGASAKQLADQLGIGRPTLLRLLAREGVKIRGRSAAERLKWAGMDRVAIERQCSAAWESVRGRRRSPQEIAKSARTMMARMRRVGRYEFEICSALRDAGFGGRVQRACGRYNLDIGIDEPLIAIEVQEGGVGSRRGSLRLERLEYILDQGYSLLIVYRRLRQTLDLPRVAEQCVAFSKLLRGQPSTIGQYGMIGRDGQPVTSRRLNLDSRTRVPGF